MNLDHLPDVRSTRVLPAQQFMELFRASWYLLRRLAGRENRYYLLMNGKVIARFVSAEDHLAFCRWLADTHRANADYSFTLGREYAVAKHLQDTGTLYSVPADPDASAPSPT